MSQLVITDAGVTYKDSVFAGQEVQNVTHFIFRNVPDLSENDPIDSSMALPESHIVKSLPIERVSRLNDNAVVMSATLGYDIGNFDYNWFGAVATKADGSHVLIAVVHTNLQTKTKTQGAKSGNYSVKSIVWRTSGVADDLNVELSTLPWQVESENFVTSKDFDEHGHTPDEIGALAKNNGNVLIKPIAAPHGSVTIDGIKSNYAGIHFSDVNHTLMVHPLTQGFYNHNDNAWDWYFNNGVLTQGKVPWGNVTGTGHVYTTLNKPTPNDIGALAKNGGNDRIRPLAVSHGSITVSGASGSYAGIHFDHNDHTLMMHSLSQGVYNHGNNTWAWRFDNGQLAVGTVPLSLVTGKSDLALRAAVNTFTQANNFSHSLMVKGHHVYHEGNKPTLAQLGAAPSDHTHAAANSLVSYGASYDKMGKNIHADGGQINHLYQLHFLSGVHLKDYNSSYVDLKSAGSTSGIRVKTSNDQLCGYLYGYQTGEFGLVNKDGQWSYKILTNGNVEMFVGSNKQLEVNNGNVNAVNELREKGQRVYSPNNKPTAEELGVIARNKSQGAAYVAGYRKTSASSVGTKIRLPFNTDAGKMVSFSVRIYQSYKSYVLSFAGYLYGSQNQWYSPTVRMESGAGGIEFKMGRDSDGRAYIWIQGGSHRGIGVFNVISGFNGADWNSGWEISESDDTPNIALFGVSRPSYSPHNKPTLAELGAADANHTHAAANSLVSYDSSYDIMGKSLHANNKSINYVNQLHFQDGTHFVDYSASYLDFKYSHASHGGIRLRSSNGTVNGYLYSDYQQSSGLLNANGEWALKTKKNGDVAMLVDGVDKFRVTNGHSNSLASIEFSNYGLGMVGLYNSAKWQQVFAMGSAYTASADGSSIAGAYGIFWSHPNNTDGHAKKVGGHHLCVVSNGVTKSAIGDDIWTQGYITATKAIHANGGLTQNGHAVLNGADTWLRTNGEDGVYFASHGGGFHMTDANWIRSYGGKGIYVDKTSINAINTAGGVEVGEGFYRKSHSRGALIGSYNNVGVNALYTNPMYCIGSAYQPKNAELDNMYGVGFCAGTAPFLSWAGASGWGQYIASDGDARIFLDATSGNIHAKGDLKSFQTSDRNLKDKIKPVTVDVDVHMSLEPSHYRKLVKGRAASKCGTIPKTEDSYVLETGMFAQQMQELGFHNFVHENEDGDLTLKQGGNELHAYHIAVTQDLYKTINSQSNLIEKLSKRLERVEQAVG